MRHAPSNAKRQGQMAIGWRRLGAQVPNSLCDLYASKLKHHGDSKLMGTAGIALILSAPEPVRLRLMKAVHERTWPDPDALNSSSIFDEFMEAMDEYRAGQGDAPSTLNIKNISA